MTQSRTVFRSARPPARFGTSLVLALSALGCAGGSDERMLDEPSTLRDESAVPEHDATDADAGATDDDAPAPGAYPWSKDQCDGVYELRVSSGVDAEKPYTVQPEVPVSPQFLYDAPWGDEIVRAVAFHPLIDNEAVLKDWYLYNARDGVQLAGWQRGRAFWPGPREDHEELPRGAESLRLDLHYHNKASTPATDRSGVAICVKRVFGG